MQQAPSWGRRPKERGEVAPHASTFYVDTHLQRERADRAGGRVGRPCERRAHSIQAGAARLASAASREDAWNAFR